MDETMIIFQDDTMTYTDGVLTKHTVTVFCKREQDSFVQKAGQIELLANGRYVFVTEDYKKNLSIVDMNTILEEMKSRAQNYQSIKLFSNIKE